MRLWLKFGTLSCPFAKHKTIAEVAVNSSFIRFRNDTNCGSKDSQITNTKPQFRSMAQLDHYKKEGWCLIIGFCRGFRD